MIQARCSRCRQHWDPPPGDTHRTCTRCRLYRAPKVNPVLEALANAPIDDEPTTEEDRRAIATTKAKLYQPYKTYKWTKPDAETHKPPSSPPPKVERESAPTILAIGDCHYPFTNEATIKAIVEFARKHQPDAIIQVGDLYDKYSFSRYPRSLNVTTPLNELSEGRAGAENMWRWLRKAAPKAECYQLLGNHDERPFKRILERAPEFESLLEKPLTSLFEFDGVHTVRESTLIINDVCFMHGYLKHGEHHRITNMKTVCGHTHRGGVVFGASTWELNAGFTGNIDAEVFSYHAMKRFHGTTQGVGWIDEYGPRFIRFGT